MDEQLRGLDVVCVGVRMVSNREMDFENRC